MFRKIRSKSDLNATIGSEIKKEFAPYIKTIKNKVVGTLNNHSKQFFIAMLGIILISIPLMFMLKPKALKNEDRINIFHERPKLTIPGGKGVIESIDEISELNRLQKGLQVVLEKKELNREDSLFIEEAVFRIEAIQLHSKRKKNESRF